LVNHNEYFEYWRIATAIPTIGLTWYAAARDFAIRKISNQLALITVYIGIVLRIGSAIFFNMPLWEDLVSILWSVSFLFILMIGWNFRLIGGGDVKLWAALSLVLPLSMIQQQSLVFSVFIAGGVEALIYQLIYKYGEAKSIKFVSPAGRKSMILKRILKIESRRAFRRSSIPYGIAIAIGSTATVLFMPMTGSGFL